MVWTMAASQSATKPGDIKLNNAMPIFYRKAIEAALHLVRAWPDAHGHRLDCSIVNFPKSFQLLIGLILAHSGDHASFIEAGGRLS